MKYHRIPTFIAFFILISKCRSDDYEEYGDPITNCQSNDAYPNLYSCINECKSIHIGTRIVTIGDIDNSKMHFKVVELDKNEFKYDRGYLLTNLPIKIDRDSFVVNENVSRAYVCYPLDPDFVNCSKWHLEEDEFELHNNSRYLLSKPHNTLYPLGKFYLERFPSFVEAGVCIPTKALTAKKEPVDSMFLAAYAISAISLFITFILSVTIPELNIRNNYILLCHLVVLTFAYVLLFVRNFITESTRNGCLVLALLQQFTLLASFFWINVQAIDLYIRFINLRSCDMRTSMLRFVMYCLYAWGCPSIICFITLVMEKTDVQVLHPKFRLHCWFASSDKLTTFVYFYGPIALLLLANVILFILTVNKLYRVGKSATNVNKKMHNQLLQLYLKLVVVMGLCWIMEIVSWAVGGEKKIWHFTDLINALQGLLIFIVYVCKPNYIRKIVTQNSYLANRVKWRPWKKQNEREAGREDGTKTHASFSTTTSLTCNESAQVNTTVM